ncbi:origin recognition complex subunit 3 N-terminus-domain-containing protein [Dichomitus squalens]|nr:origin recognition complex subunit 3 N-terminus-domain-containing protein [Dichomitus squalens]
MTDVVDVREDEDASGRREIDAYQTRYDLQIRAYKAAWTRCLDRNILKALHVPIVNDITEQVRNAYADVLPGLPCPELPVVALAGTSIFDYHMPLRHDAQYEDVIYTSQVHLYPAECSSVMNMMKVVVTGFVDRRAVPIDSGKRKPTSLASFDINLLRTWYDAQDAKPRLTVFLHEFEKFDTSVVQDVFYICRQVAPYMHIPHLPLVFVLVMSSPPSPSFLQSAYPRSTLALLRVHHVASPAGLMMVKEVLTKTFFDPDFEPDIMLGPGALEHIIDFASRHTASPDALVTMLQLAHLKHFSSNPLSTLVHDELLGTTLHRAGRTLTSSAGLALLVDALHARLLAASESRPQSQRNRDARPQTADELLAAVSGARTVFLTQARRLRVAFAVARIAECVALGEAPQGVPSGKSAEGRGMRLDSMEMLSSLLRGRGSSQVRYVCMANRKLSATKLRALLEALHSFWYDMESATVRRDEEDARIWIVETLNQLPAESEDPREDDLPVPQDAQTKRLAGSVGDWLQEYIEQRLVRLEDRALWDIWYTGATPFPSELINPAPRPTVVHALLHPHDFIRSYEELTRASGDGEHVFGAPEEQNEPALWELPDTSIAFRRYVEAGRMVNVFDWFESFAVVLESQYKHLKRGKDMQEDENMDAGVDEDADVDMDEEEEEQWKVKVQARFMRALHELDYMGFVRHTGRKPDHVIRTIYDVPD